MDLYYSNKLAKDNVEKDIAENVEVPANYMGRVAQSA